MSRTTAAICLECWQRDAVAVPLPCPHNAAGHRVRHVYADSLRWAPETASYELDAIADPRAVRPPWPTGSTKKIIVPPEATLDHHLDVARATRDRLSVPGSALEKPSSQAKGGA